MLIFSLQSRAQRTAPTDQRPRPGPLERTTAVGRLGASTPSQPLGARECWRRRWNPSGAERQNRTAASVGLSCRGVGGGGVRKR